MKTCALPSKSALPTSLSIWWIILAALIPSSPAATKLAGVERWDTPLWEEAELRDIKRQIEGHGMVWAGIENFDPAHWHDVLLDGPKKEQQLQDLCELIGRVGRVGVPVIGYNFSLAGVWGWERRPVGRGGAMSVCFDPTALDIHEPIPNGMVWNMVYDDNPPQGVVGPVSSEQIWQRLEDFNGLRTSLLRLPGSALLPTR